MASLNNAQKSGNKRVQRALNRGYRDRIKPSIDRTQDSVLKEVLGAFRYTNDGGTVDLTRQRTVDGEKTTVGKQLRQDIGRAYTSGSRTTNASLSAVTGSAYKIQASQVNFMFSVVTNTDISLPTKRQFFQAKRTQVGGLTLQERLNINTAQKKQRLIKLIFNGLSRGDGPREMARTVQQAFGIEYTDAVRIVRTEGGRMQGLGDYDQTVRARKEGINMVRMIVSTLDDRTRAQSARVDGLIETLEPNGAGVFRYGGREARSIPGGWEYAAWDINDREGTIKILQDPEGNPINMPEERVSKDVVTRDGRPVVGRRVVGTNQDGTPRYRPITFQSRDIKWSSFDDWAKSRGLKRNRYGEPLFD